MISQWLLCNQVCTSTLCIEPISATDPKKWRKMREMPSKSVTTNKPPLGGHHLLPSWLLGNQVCTPTQCIEAISATDPKKWCKMREMPSKSVTTNESPLGGHHLSPSWLLRNQVCTPIQCIEPISASVPKQWREMREMPSKSVTTNKPPLVGHHLLPSWLLRNQVCTPTQCIEPISVSVPKSGAK